MRNRNQHRKHLQGLAAKMARRDDRHCGKNKAPNAKRLPAPAQHVRSTKAQRRGIARKSIPPQREPTRIEKALARGAVIPANLSRRHPDYGLSMRAHLARKAGREATQ